MKKDFKDNVAFGKNVKFPDISCQEAQRIILKIAEKRLPPIDEAIILMDHTRVCFECASVFIKKVK